jgi:nucleotide-binding universal stress UspA family protein
MFERILVCLDGSKLAEQILPYATEEALKFDSRVTLLQVMTIPSSVSAAAGAAAQTGDIMKEESQRQEADTRTYLDSVGQGLLKKGVNTDCVVLQPSPPGEAIVKYGRDNSIDLICIATHGRSGLGRAVFGSVADHILRESGLPILLIRPKEAST